MEEADTTSPEFASATLDEATGKMTITFSETIDISGADLSLMYISDAGEKDTVSLSGADFDMTADDSDTISLTLIQTQLDSVISMDTPQLDIEAGAVKDLAENGIDAAPDSMITVTEAPPNIPPTAQPATATTAEDTAVVITPVILDPDEHTPRISAVDDPPHGTATHTDTTITYTPDQDFSGTDSFTYTATDGEADAQGTVTVTVTRDNNDPILGAIGDQFAQAGTQLSITPTATDADPTDTHSYSIARGTLPAEAAFTPSSGTLTWTPAQEDEGSTHTVTITVRDGRGGSDSETFDIIVRAQSDVSLDTVLWNATITSMTDDDGLRGWTHSGLGDIDYHATDDNTFDFEGQTYSITGLYDEPSSSRYQLDI